MGPKFPKVFLEWKKQTALFLVLVIVVSSFGNVFFNTDIFNIKKAEAAQVTIDPGAQTLGTSHIMAGTQTVFVDDQTGYKFFRDAPGYCVYRKTTNGGTSWSGTTTVDAQTDCQAIQVWYDQWTPGDTGTYIHIATLDSSVDDIFYNRLDTNGDTLLMGTGPRDVSTNSGNSTATFGVGANTVSITKGTDGTIYTTLADTTDSYVVECSATCNLAASWTETGANPLTPLANDYSILAPLPGGNIMLISRAIAAGLEDIRYKIWNNTAWSAAWTTIDGNATDNTLYDVGMAVAVSTTTPGNIYLAYTARNAALGGDDQIRGAKYNGSTWATTTDIVTSTTLGLTNVAIGLDAANDDVYVAYSGRTNTALSMTTNVYWKMATSSMMNWSAQTGPINSAADDVYGLDINPISDQRIYATWFASSTDDILGDTLADIFPGIHASTSGSQTTSVNASTSNFYVGGNFILYNTYNPIDVTGITISESGTVDGSTNVTNIKLLYEMDTSAPYNCASESYGGSESQFGSTDTSGFSGANGVSSFTGTTETVSTTSTMCAYVVLDVLDNTPTGSTIDISIADPVADITASGPSGPTTAQNITGTTNVLNDMPTQMHYHWRNDNGIETAATSKTSGVEDTGYTAFQPGTTARLRLEVSNEGGSSTPNMQYRLEYAELTDTCDVATGWTDVGATNGVFDMYNSTNLTDGNNTTNIAVATGGVTDENTTFLTPNAGVKDTSSQTANILLSTTQYVELEYSIIATSTAPEGTTYCFRVTDAGNPIYAYNQYARTNIAADVLVTASSTQKATSSIPISNLYIGGKYVITENIGSRNVTSITIAEAGTVDGVTGLDNIKLYYELDTSLPYNCDSETYAGLGGETQFGSTDTDGFSSENGTSTFTGSVAITTTSTMCLYVVLDSGPTAQNGETVDIVIEDPSTNVVVTGGGSVSPTITRDITGSTTFQGAVMTQTHYHWRTDNGTEISASSTSNGVADTAITNIGQTTPVRLRVQVSNEGATSSASTTLAIEYGAKLTTCSAVSSWTDVGLTGGAFDMYNSPNLTDGNNTTDIAVADGGMANENTTFKTPNSGVKDTSSIVATTTLSPTEFIEVEYAIQQTVDAGFDIPYCFRVTSAGIPLNAYTNYAELRTSPERDFEIQRKTTTMLTGATSTVLVAGVDYTAPSASTSAFIRITNIGMTGAGHASGNVTAQNASNVTAYFLNPSNIMTSVTLARTGTATTTLVSWEIIEFIGEPGSDNEMIVRSQSFQPFTTTGLVATGTSASVTDDTDVVVFITGQQNPLANSTAYNTGLTTSDWNYAGNVPVFRRESASTNAINVSYAVVEFTGPNWIIQRAEHTFALAGVTETEPITAVGSLTRTFIHTQKRNTTGLNGTDEFGAEVWLSSIGFVSFFLESGATTPTGQTSVAWIIENIQTTSGAMEVTRDSGWTSAGTAPLRYVVTLPSSKVLSDLTNASIFGNARSSVAGTTHPRAIAGLTISSSTAYEIWRSNTGSILTYRTEIVEWPTAGLALKQNHYQFYVDNDALTPTDPWPGLDGPLGEDTILMGSDNPLGEGEHIRIRMSVQALNATLPANTKAFKLQFAQLITECSAISEVDWDTLGNSASSTIWRGYDAAGITDGTQLSGDPPTGGDLVLPSVSDVAGTIEEENNSEVNAYAVQAGEDIEYDWIVEQNGANAETFYCFRMVESNGSVFSTYYQHPRIRTASFTPKTQNWRWYSGVQAETPTTTLAIENVAPVNITNGQPVKLRVTAKEVKNISRDDVRFKLQYSEYANFSTADDVVATSSCLATSTWCYADGGGTDNVKITTGTLSDANSCVASVGNGCGTHNESPNILTGFRHNGSAAVEYEFTIQSAGPRVNRVYYFRLYDLVQDTPVPKNDGYAYPSLVTEGASLTFAMAGVASSTVVEGVTTDFNTTPSAINFGVIPLLTMREGAHRLTVDTDGTEGYQLYMTMTGNLQNYTGAAIEGITGTNAAPSAWGTGCLAGAASCFGYHTSDDTLQYGSTRFSAIDTYARLSTTSLEEVSYSSQPTINEVTDIVFRVFIRQLQDSGLYETTIRYISVPMF